jgi:hypothetical protein
MIKVKNKSKELSQPCMDRVSEPSLATGTVRARRRQFVSA